MKLCRLTRLESSVIDRVCPARWSPHAIPDKVRASNSVTRRLDVIRSPPSARISQTATSGDQILLRTNCSSKLIWTTWSEEAKSWIEQYDSAETFSKVQTHYLKSVLRVSINERDAFDTRVVKDPWRDSSRVITRTLTEYRSDHPSPPPPPKKKEIDEFHTIR